MQVQIIDLEPNIPSEFRIRTHNVQILDQLLPKVDKVTQFKLTSHLIIKKDFSRAWSVKKYKIHT